MNAKKNLKKLFDKFFWKQHPEAALRYMPVISEIEKAKLKGAKILEVGSGALGIVPYIKREIDGIDVDFTGTKSELLHEIKGTATKLPFRRNSYDVVISSDVLEHLKKENRPQAIEEQIRVAKKLAIIVVPVGELSEEQDKELSAYWNKVFQKSGHQFLQEHIENGLPRTDEILVTIDKSLRSLKKEAKVKSYPSLNLAVRKFLMKTWISKNKFFYYLYLKGYLLLIPLLKFANFGNCYRRVFVIEFR
ncbi:MAG: class I SAM-dependent methyltransferase [Candidatus Curtissbacteria bacterium]|nr:class I SAM-dependent methyltransferase [Candidatus Curtissbacteria bacterium]